MTRHAQAEHPHAQAEHPHAQAEHQSARTTALAPDPPVMHLDDPRVLHLDDPPVHNRLLAVMAHVPWYCFRGQARLARDARVSRAALSRLITGRSRPSFHLVWALSRALERRLGRPLDPRELVSFDGTYPTPSACALTGCRGCLPHWAYDAGDALRPAFQGQAPGEWSLAPSEWFLAAGERAIATEERTPPAPQAVAGRLSPPSADRRRGGKWGRG